jgi:HEAT repeats
VALLVLWLAPGCKRNEPGKLYLEHVQVSEIDLAGHPMLGIGIEDLRQRTEEALVATNRVALVHQGEKAPDGGAPWLASVEIPLVREVPGASADVDIPSEASRAEIAVEVSLMRPGGDRLRAEGQGDHAFAPGDPEERGRAFASALTTALDAAAQGLSLQLEASEKPDSELLVSLRSGDPRSREIALRVLADRRSKAAVPALIKQLDSPDRDLQLRTVGALATIGDPAAVPALIEATSQKDPGYVIQVAYALGDLGGPDAEAFLFTLSGHLDKAVQDAAAQALDTLRKKRDLQARRTPPQQH